jgi:hypothetical protein
MFVAFLRTTCVSPGEYREQLSHLVELLEKSVTLVGGKILSPSGAQIPSNSFHWVSKGMDILLGSPSTTKTQRAVLRLLEKQIGLLELSSGSAGKLLPGFLVYILREHLRKGRESVDEHVLLDEAERLLNTRGHVSKEEDLLDLLADQCSEPLVTVITEALQLSGVEGKIQVNKGSQPHFVIESRTGYEFPITTPLYSLFDKITFTWDRNDVTVLLVNGCITTVAEMDLLFRVWHENKKPVILFALGFSEEILSTIHVNHNNRRLDVIPVVVPPLPELINTIGDLGVVVNQTPVSSLRGDLISGIKPEDLGRVHRVTVNGQRTIISHTGTEAPVELLRQHIVRKRNQEPMELQGLFDARLKTLSGHTVDVYLPNVAQQLEDSYRMQIDQTLREAKALLSGGWIPAGDFLPGFSGPPTRKLPRTSVGLAYRTALSLAGQLLSTHHVVTL